MKALRKPHPRRGIVLVLALIVVVLVGVSLIPVAQYVRQTSGLAYSTRGSDLAFYAAEAGIARALSYIYEAGSGDVLGINEAEFQVTEDDPLYPFGEDWVTMEEGITTDNGAALASRVKIYYDDSESGWVVSSVGRSMVPVENYRQVEVTITAGTFARYAFFNSTSLSTMDGQRRWLAPGETFNGPVHSNRHLFVYGTNADPLTFNSDVTIVGNEVRSANSSQQNVVYNGLKDTDAGYIELPANLTTLVNAAEDGGLDLPGDATISRSVSYVDPNPTINNYKFVFNAAGTVTFTDMDYAQWQDAQTGWSTSAAMAAASQTIDLEDINGAMIVRDGNVIVSGVVNGRVTLAALTERSDPSDPTSAPANPALQTYTTSKTDGNVIVDGNLVYNTHPLVDGNYDVSDNREFDPETVTDVMGLIAERNFVLDGSVPTNTVIDAHVMLTGQASPNPDVRDWGLSEGTINSAINQDGAFFVEDGVQRDLSERWTGITDDESGNGSSEWSGSGTNGNLYLTGGVVHFIRGQTANGDGGYTRKYVFDTRLLTDPPPFYPLTPDLEITRWRDVASRTEPE